MTPTHRLIRLLSGMAAVLLLGPVALLKPAFGQLAGTADQRHRVFVMPSNSMLPTLAAQDRLLVDKQPVTVLQRGDLVVIQVRGEQWLKRIVGLPGDRVAMRNGQVILNGEPVAQRFDSDIELTGELGLQPQKARRLIEQFPGEAQPHRILDLGPREFDETEEVQLGTDQFFLMGDNRDNSADSRMADRPGWGLGLVDRKQLYGRATYRFWRTGSGFELVELHGRAQ